MVDFSGLGAKVEDFLSLPYRETVIDQPVIVTVTTSAKQLIGGSYKWVLSFVIRVRSMGTATYIRIGTQSYQSYSLTIVGQTLGWSGNRGEVVDMSKFWVIGDTSDAVLEIIVSYLPLHLIGNVEISIGRE